MSLHSSFGQNVHSTLPQKVQTLKDAFGAKAQAHAILAIDRNASAGICVHMQWQTQGKVCTPPLLQGR